MIAKQKSRENILIVDDTPANLNVLSTLLKENGYRVRAAINGKLAIKTTIKSPPDLIILDIMMPGMDGYEVCAQLKKDEKTRHIPIIFISALNRTENIVKGFAVGGVDYITKPFKTAEVLARIESQLTIVRQQKQIEEQYEQDINYFKKLDKLKEAFLHSATHDLRTPLSSIQLLISLLDRNNVIEDVDKRSTYMARIANNVNRIDKLITDMLDFAQAESSISISSSPVSLINFLENCFHDFEILANQKNITLSISPPKNDSFVSIDSERMQHVMDNLLSNAIKYTPEGGEVKIVSHVYNDNFTIQVIDSGLGIPENDRQYIFDTFYRVRTKEHLEVEGTGLGLSIVKEIINQHNGEISVDSQFGKGIIFTMNIPQA